MSGGDAGGDDDDFQIPGQVALSQNLILSSLKSSICQPLKPSNGSRSMKRPRPFSAIGKENAIMLKSQTPDSRDSKGGAKSANSKRKKPYQNIFPVGLGKSDIALGCAEEVVIEDQNSINTLKIVDSWPCREESFENSSRRFKSVESCLLKYGVSASFNLDENFSSVRTYNDEVGTKLSSSCDSEKSVTMWEMESALECKGSNETVVKESSLALDELRLAGDSISRDVEVESLNNFVHRSTAEGQREISSHARLFELKENPVLSGRRNFSLGIDGCEESKGNKEVNHPKVPENGSTEGTQFVSSGNFQADLVLLDNRKGNLNAMSIEAKLLNPNGNVGLFTINSFVEKEEFEPGSQLNVLMDLCCEMGEQGGSENGMSSSEQINLSTEFITLENNLVIQCPLCQTDITKMSEEMRHIHTNECLDKYDTNEVTVPTGQTKLNTFQQDVDTNPVLEWLSALDLCRYEEAFIKEEIDWDTLQWLTEEDLLSIGVVALGPRKKILHALKELRQSNCIGQDRGNDRSISGLIERKRFGLPGNKLITEYFPGSVAYKARGDNVFRYFDNIENANKGLTQKRVGIQRNIKRRTIREIPPWCCIPGTPFRVDAFRYLRGDCCHWFLTHFHMDHYQGLTKNFCHGKVYCSEITARLVHTKIGVPWERIQILPLNQKITIGGINLTCLDANHCPGSIIILFEPSNKKAVLHTGDFRFSAEMVSSSVLQSSCIHTLILDTTYCNPQYDFPRQEEVIQFVIDAIQAETFNPKTLFLIGTYTIGKERLFLEVARTLKRKVYVGAGKLHLLECLGLPEEDIQLFTSNEMESCIHVVPMWTIASFKRLKHISNRYSEQYNLIVAFSPTGWTFGKGKKKTPGRRLQQGTIIRYEVPYSEHCSFTELKEFVRFISPENIIPSVNNEGPASVEAMLALLSSPDS